MIYQVAGRRHFETFYCENRSQAIDELKVREAKATASRLPEDPRRLRYEDLAADLLNDYSTNRRRSLPTLRGHLKHLEKFFRGYRAVGISTSLVRRYSAERLAAGAKPATVNREMGKLKRMFTLAIEDERLDARPHIPMLREDNVRRGFFEVMEFEAVVKRLPEYVQPVAEFAYLTGWRLSEITSLRREQVDVRARVLRLWSGTTKTNRAGCCRLRGSFGV